MCSLAKVVVCVAGPQCRLHIFKNRYNLVRKPPDDSKHIDIVVDSDLRIILGLRPYIRSKFSTLNVIASEDRIIWFGGGLKIRIRSFRIENSLRVPTAQNKMCSHSLR
jgi:hypothetical protein